MRHAARPGWLLALALVTCGCGTSGYYRAVEPRAQTIGGVYVVEPQRAWSALRYAAVETWTIDGVALESLRFFSGIEDGQPLGREGGTTDPRPRFQSGLTAAELVDLVSDSLFGSQFQPRNARPWRFAGAVGFRFDIEYATADGVRREALVAGAVLQRRLYLLVYQGTELHHFARYRDEAVRIIESIRLTDVAARRPRE